MKSPKSKSPEAHGFSRAQLDEMVDDLMNYAGRIRRFRKVKRKVEDNCIVHISGEIELMGLGDFKFMIIPFAKHEKFWTIHLENAHSSMASGNTVSAGLLPMIIDGAKKFPSPPTRSRALAWRSSPVFRRGGPSVTEKDLRQAHRRMKVLPEAPSSHPTARQISRAAFKKQVQWLHVSSTAQIQSA